MLTALLATAFAQTPPAPKPWVSEPYARPRFNARAISVNGRSAAQAIVGGEIGLRYDHAQLSERDGQTVRLRPDLVGRTRLQADVLYGLTSGSTGYGLRLGSFLGPTAKMVTFQLGPDLWANGYGNPESLDYHLPFSLGVDVMALALFQIDPSVTAQVGIIPGWAFAGPRQVGGVGPFHELTAFGLVSLDIGGMRVNVGYQRTYNAAGVFDGLILSGGF